MGGRAGGGRLFPFTAVTSSVDNAGTDQGRQTSVVLTLTPRQDGSQRQLTPRVSARGKRSHRAEDTDAEAVSRAAPEEQGGEDADDRQELPWQPLTEDLYGLAATALIRDCHMLAQGLDRRSSCVRWVRLSVSVALVIANGFLQAYLVAMVKQYITAPAVVSARGVYGEFEASLYDETTTTEHGSSRGLPGHFHPDRFDSMPEAVKESACQIALSQPHFLITFVLLWSLTCFADVKRALLAYHRCCFKVPLVHTMALAMCKLPSASGADGSVRKVVGITRPLRVAILFLVTLPRICVSLALLWLGCRWLVATTSFADLFLNAVALKYVIKLKDTFYAQLLPDRNKRDVKNTLFPPTSRFETPSINAYVYGLVMFPCALAWSMFYVFNLQAVLPQYRWDVHDICKEWLAQHFAV